MDEKGQKHQKQPKGSSNVSTQVLVSREGGVCVCTAPPLPKGTWCGREKVSLKRPVKSSQFLSDVVTDLKKS